MFHNANWCSCEKQEFSALVLYNSYLRKSESDKNRSPAILASQSNVTYQIWQWEEEITPMYSINLKCVVYYADQYKRCNKMAEGRKKLKKVGATLPM